MPILPTSFFAKPIISGSSQAIWQNKVAADVQGRVFSVRRMIALSLSPVAFAMADPPADRVFTPLLMPEALWQAESKAISSQGPGGASVFYSS